MTANGAVHNALHGTQRTPTTRLTLNSTQLTQYTRHAATAPTQHNDVNHSVFLDYNFSKEQCMLPEDDRVIETCWECFKCFNVNFRLLNKYMYICWCVN